MCSNLPDVRIYPTLTFHFRSVAMIRSTKKGPPKHLEKMLFINHKEDILLQDRLAELNLRSKLRIMDLDRERIKVRNELRNSRKKQIDVKDAAMLCVAAINPYTSTAPVTQNDKKLPERKTMAKTSHRKLAVSAPPGGRLSMISEVPTQQGKPGKQAVSELSFDRNTPVSSLGRVRKSSINKFRREVTLPDIKESFSETEEDSVNMHPIKTIPKAEIDLHYKRTRSQSMIDESVGAYVLGEFTRISQVVPSILMALTRKDEEDEEEDYTYLPEEDNPVKHILDYEPDLHKVRKTVSAVKKLRHRMSISKKLEVNRPSKTLEQMIREKTESEGVQNEYTDGTCVLMKRRLEKKRRNSAVPGLSQPSFMLRRQSLFAPTDLLTPSKPKKTPSVGPQHFQRNRSQSVYNLPSMSRSNSLFGFRSSLPGPDNESPVIDEDEYLNRQKVIRELENFAKINIRVDQFLASHDGRKAGMRTVYQ